jgi:hypothetical protein
LGVGFLDVSSRKLAGRFRVAGRFFEGRAMDDKLDPPTPRLVKAYRAYLENEKSVAERDAANASADTAWKAFLDAAKRYEPFMDQFDRVKWRGASGMVYLSIGRSDAYPDSFEPLPAPSEPNMVRDPREPAD